MWDYSKWDNIDVSSDGDDDCSKPMPRVTKYDKPVKVSFGGKNDEIQILKEDNVKPLYESDYFDILKVTKNGGITSKYAWSQSKNEITFHIFVTNDAKGPQLNVIVEPISSCEYNKGSLPDCEGRPVGRVINITQTLSDMTCKAIIRGVFPYSVLLNEDLLFWEVKTFLAVKNIPKKCPFDFSSISRDNPLKTINVTLTKHLPIQNAVLWWNCLFEGDDVIDVDIIEERSTEKHSENKKLFFNVWENAHKEFREKVKNTKPVMIPIDNESDSISQSDS